MAKSYKFHIISAVSYGESKDMEQLLMCNEGSLDYILRDED